MKRIVLAIVIAINALSLAAYTTRAVWSSSVTVSNNKIQTGTANLLVSVDSGTNFVTSAASTLTLNDLIPGGQTNKSVFSLRNASTTGVDFNINAQVSTIATLPNANLDLSKLQLSIYESTASAELGPGSSGWFSVTDWQSTARSLNSFLVVNSSSSRIYNLAARLLSSADNTWQGQTVTIGLTVTGTQPAGSF